MKSYLCILGIAIGAGIIDILPMLIRKEKRISIVSAFIHWFGLGIIIPFLNWEIHPILKGLLVGELMSLPIIIVIGDSDRKAIIPMSIISAVLGILISVFSSYLI